MLLDRYSPTPYNYATPKVDHLPPVKCPPLHPPSETPPAGHLPPLLRPTLHCDNTGEMYNIVFNASKSKCIMVNARRKLAIIMFDLELQSVFFDRW